MPYGKQIYDSEKDMFTCEFPIKSNDGTYEICKKECQDLVRHITRGHGITVAEYKKMLGLDKGEKLLSKRTLKKLRTNIKLKTISQANLQPSKYAFKPGENKIQSYTRSPQTRSRLRRLHLYRRSHKLKTTP